jgi:hypothetical protein
VLVMSGVKPELLSALVLVPRLVMEGELWRPFTFLFIPPVGDLSLLSLIFAMFGWFLFYLMGTALENHWGTFRYNVFLLVGWMATVAAAFVTPDVPSTNVFVMGSVFLAFAFLNPDFELYIMFLLPVKVKWLALIAWCGYAIMLIVGPWETRLAVLASVSNFLLFFGKELYFRVKGARRRMALQAKQFATVKPEYFHRCSICGITDKTHPKMEFRYCSKCTGSPGYCMEHLKNHEHVTAPQTAAGPS